VCRSQSGGYGEDRPPRKETDKERKACKSNSINESTWYRKTDDVSFGSSHMVWTIINVKKFRGGRR